MKFVAAHLEMPWSWSGLSQKKWKSSE
jgi:hypothetical protein